MAKLVIDKFKLTSDNEFWMEIAVSHFREGQIRNLVPVYTSGSLTLLISQSSEFVQPDFAY